MKTFTPAADDDLRLTLDNLRKILDLLIESAHSYGLLGVAVDCFLAQANLQSALDRLQVRRLEASARRAALSFGCAAASRGTAGGSPTDSARPALRAWEYKNADGSRGVCAWCQKELNIQPARDESHGICPRHLLLMELQLQRLNGQRQHEAAN